MWKDISERCTGSAQSGGKAHVLGRRDISFEQKVVVKWPTRQKQKSEGIGASQKYPRG